MPRLQLLFVLVCCMLATPVFAASSRPEERITALRWEENQLILGLSLTGEAVPSYLYFPEPSLAQPLVQKTMGAKVQVKSQGADRYDRIMVALTQSKNALAEEWLRAGVAVLYSPAAITGVKRLEAAERDARDARRGVWAEKDFVRNMQHVTRADSGTFMLVRGTVTRTYKSRDRYYINFGEDWRSDFSVAIPRKAWRSFGKTMEVAPGTTVLVRGVVVEENGPMIYLTRPEQLERSSHGKP